VSGIHSVYVSIPQCAKATMIFLSHTHTDNPVVEPVALQLREIFGTQNVFYDSWSIQLSLGRLSPFRL
jgi:hypothetical protein